MRADKQQETIIIAMPDGEFEREYQNLLQMLRDELI